MTRSLLLKRIPSSLLVLAFLTGARGSPSGTRPEGLSSPAPSSASALTASRASAAIPAASSPAVLVSPPRMSKGALTAELLGPPIPGGRGTVAAFWFPTSVAVDASGNVYVADTWNNRVRKVSPAGEVTTLAGTGTSGFADGAGIGAQFYWPAGAAVDGSGNVYVADTGNHRVRKVSPAGQVTTLVAAE